MGLWDSIRNQSPEHAKYSSYGYNWLLFDSAPITGII